MLALKLTLVPVLLVGVTLLGRRLGPRVAGLAAGLPLTSGPISLFVALEQGSAFARSAAVGTIAGLSAVCCFCTVYALCADSMSWLRSLLVGVAFFALASLALSMLSFGLWPATVLAAVSVLLGLALMPAKVAATPNRSPPIWDLPARVAAATALVLLLTEVAPALGPEMTGLLAPFPLFAGLLASFTHAQNGGSSARALLRGVVAGSPGFVTFFVCVGVSLGTLGIVPCYALAVVIAAATQLLALRTWARAPVQAG
jgi:hypothetical protein